MNFAVYRSSAGSGKTFSLVREYLKMVLKHPSGFRHILAITFTHKAANEMKERVMNTLHDLSRSAETPLSGSSRQMQLTLVKETGLDEKEIAQRATEALSLILHHYSEFSIGTIDSFSHRIIRAFAHDFGLPVSFGVELESDELLTTAVDLLLEKAGSDEQLTRLLVSFLESRMEEDKGWNIDQLLVSFAKILLDEEGEVKVKRLASLTMDDFHAISKQLFARIKTTEQQFKALGDKALSLIDRNHVPVSAFYYGKNGVPGYFAYLAHPNMDKLTPNSNVQKTLDEDKWNGPKASSEEISAINNMKGELQGICQQAETLREAAIGSYQLAKLLSKTIYPLAVLNEIGRVLDEFKRQHNLVHISEFNSRISRIVMREPIPFIYERLGEKFHHVLIDEFQDTSRLQWLNFVPLMENALAGGYFNLVVGDGKQAIYRWRNGDVDQFISLPKLPGSDKNQLIQQRETLFVEYFHEYQLDSNYRSLPEIVNFNNHFFRWLSQQLDDGLQNVYDGLEQKPASKREGGYVRLEIVVSDDALNYAEITINRTEEIIKEVMVGGYALQDIAILCRTNRHAGRIARELILRGIDVVSSESLLLSYSPEVRFITEFIRCLFEPSNSIIQASVVKYLLQNGLLAEESNDFHRLLTGIGVTSHPAEHLFTLLNRNGLEVDREVMMALPVYDLCEVVIRTFGMEKMADPYIQFFLDAVIDFMEKETHSAVDFLAWWELHKGGLSIVVPEGVDAVRVMTIHKAKGLEFPVVIFPFADESLKKPSKNFLWVDLPPEEKIKLKTAFLPMEKSLLETCYADQYQEEKVKSLLDITNVLYVALTRPEEQLYILTSPPPSKMEELKSLPAFYAAYLQSTGIWEEGKQTYEFGQFSSRTGSPVKHPGSIRTLSTMPSSDWRKAIKIRQRAPEYWDMEDPAGRVDFGSRIHAILAEISLSSDIENVLQRALLSGNIAGDEEVHIRKMLQDVVSHPMLVRYFEEGVTVRNEPEILEQQGESSRPDRVVFDGEEVVVIDYKTGRKSPSHKKQVERYGRLMHEMGYQHVKKLLVYLKGGVEVEEIKN